MMDEKYLQSIPHIDEIAHRGVFSGVPEKITDTFQHRSHEKNKLLPSLEDAIRATGLQDGMTITPVDPAQQAAQQAAEGTAAN